MGIDWSLVIAAAALLVSVLSPTLTAIVNNHHEYKKRISDFEQEHRIAAIEAYVRSTGAVCGNGTNESFAQYGAHCGEIYLYVPKELWPKIDTIAEKLQEPDYISASKELHSLCKELSLKGLSPSIKRQKL